ncbi:O-antigen/teichoic acid export membrane protein [Paenibacillus phyllosphaerae]|uniref:O-antigen/teichoic acid export membrane protein n=1 Tax=Paenibacillus phyllosphaerae TaxID=274593 RepID=A0A7W5FRB3_9BACL|nr:polysaccharide biosynthesis protein [Paenibacillus phyllosphaerae]MBB3114117.1 O-antigen/teichoic acid export membrane protein [Paenibacillus phyllosphaerae]
MSSSNQERNRQPEGSGGRGATERGRRTGVLQGAAVLGGAVIISKVLGTLQKIPLQNLAGDRVFGIYNAVYPFYQLLLIMATAGLPVAISLLVAEQAATGNKLAVRRIVSASALLLGLTGAAGFFLMWSCSTLAAGWIGDEAAGSAIRASALALWVVPLLAALRGYYQGLGRMLPAALSQLSEQTVRVAAMLTLLLIGWHFGWSDERLAAGATAGSLFGGLAGLMMMGAVVWRDSRRIHVQPFASVTSKKPYVTLTQAKGRTSDPPAIQTPRYAILMKRIIRVAVPVTLGALVVPMLGVVDSFTVPRLLSEEGRNAAEAMRQFGLYSRGQPLVQLVVMVAGAVGSALVPAMVAARVRGDAGAARDQAALAMRGAWWLGAAAAMGLALLAAPINHMLYNDEAGSVTFALIGVSALFGTVNAIASSVLQGLGAVRAPALFMVAAAALKAVLNVALVPALGINGAACAGIAALGCAALLGAAAVRRESAAVLPAAQAAGLVLALAVMAAALLIIERGGAPLLDALLPPRTAATALALGGTALGAALFLAAGLRFGGLTARDLRALPGGASLAARFMRWRLLPPGE